jgi:Zn finger protein HypA/HybF involved in hydrogenase expression
MPAMPASTTPAGLLTAGEVSARYAEMRRRVNLFIPTSTCLFRAMGDLCASAVMGPGGQTWLPESEKHQIQAQVDNDPNLYNYVLGPYIIAEDNRQGAVERIASFAAQQVANAKVQWLNDIETALTHSGHSNVMTVINAICTDQKLLLIQLQELEKHEEAQASVGGETARSKLSSVRKEVEAVFDDMAEHNRVQIHAINLCKGQIEQIETEREKIQGGDLASLISQKDTLKEYAELQLLAERRKVKCERELHSYYVPDPGHGGKYKESSSKKVHLIPLGLEKGRGSELATKATLWSKANIEQTSAIHRYVLKSVQSFDSEKGLFWKPPMKSEVSSVVPSWEQTAYKRQSQWLWDQLVSAHCSADLIRLILRPTKRG